MLPAVPCWAQRGHLEGRCGPSQTRAPSGGAPAPIRWRPIALTFKPARTINTAAAIISSSSSHTSCNAFNFPLAASRRRQVGGGGGATAAAKAFVVRALGRDAAAAAAAADVPRVEEPSTALLLAWFACGNRSLFAAQCLVEVLVDLYREGRTFGEVQLSLKMATQGGRVQRRRATRADREVAAAAAAANEAGGDSAPGGEMEGGEELMLPPLLQGQEEDVLVSWVALVFLSCEELGVPRDREPAEQRLQRQQLQEAQQQGQAAAAAGGGIGSAAVGGDGGGLGAGVGLGSMAAGSAYLRGMLGYVRQTLGMYDEGQTLARVAGLQGLVQQSASAASSPFLVLMQQYTRLVLLTVEVVAAAGLPTGRPLRPPETVARPTGYSQAFSSSCNAALDECPDEPQATTAESAAAVCPARGLAVRLLMAFMGAVLGSQWSLGKFVDAVRTSYDQGLAADELFLQLDEEEFVQSGGLLPISGAASAGADASAAEAATAAAAAPDATAAAPDAEQRLAAAPPPQQYQITKALLSNWISLSYMTLAQLAVPYPEAGQRLGWAWAGFGDPIEAIGMNDFVGNVLRQMAGADPRVVPQPPPLQPAQQAGPGADAAAAAVPADIDAGPVDGSLSGAEDDGDSQLLPASAGTGDRRRGGALMVRVEDEMLPTTSTAFRVLTQQVALVQAVCGRIMTGGQD